MPRNTLYSDLSHYYDLMCSTIDYEEQCTFSHRVFNLLATRQSTGVPRSLDLACGTGPHVERLLSLGFNASGLDINAPMLEHAQIRCPSAHFSQQDMRDFRFDDSFSLVTCFLYSIHYNYPKNNFLQTLQNAYNALEYGGLFIFDMVGRDFIANDSGFTHYLNNSEGHFAFQSRWHDSKASDKLDLIINITKDSGGIKKHWQDQHTMLAINIGEVITQLQKMGFDVHPFERDYTKLAQWQGDVGNVILVCVKPKSSETRYIE